MIKKEMGNCCNVLSRIYIQYINEKERFVLKIILELSPHSRLVPNNNYCVLFGQKNQEKNAYTLGRLFEICENVLSMCM